MIIITRKEREKTKWGKIVNLPRRISAIQKTGIDINNNFVAREGLFLVSLGRLLAPLGRAIRHPGDIWHLSPPHR